MLLSIASVFSFSIIFRNNIIKKREEIREFLI